MDDTTTLFKDDLGNNVTFQDLLKKIYENSTRKQEQLIITAQNIQPLIRTLNDAVIIMPTLVQLQKVSVENDDLLVKMAAIAQRGILKNKSKVIDVENSLGITVEERRLLLQQAQKLQQKAMPGESSGEVIPYQEVEKEE